MANEDLYGLKQHCVICTKELGPERLKFRSVTCSDECQAIRQRALRKRVDDRECRYCHKPSTPSKREAFRRFQKWETTYPEHAYPELWKILEPAGVKREEFARAVRQAQTRDVILDLEYAEMEWGTTKKRRPEDRPTPELDRVLDILASHAAEQPKAEVAA